MRTLTDHIVSGDQAVQLTITVLDKPGHGGACHEYAVDTSKEVAQFGRPNTPAGETHGEGSCLIKFQNGPIKEFGVNGITQEALLAIVIDRLRSFQDGPFRCRENAIALTHCEEALMWLQQRTVARIKRGVEGTHQK